ncbi:MAG TPA: 5-deoxy-glucuronate isomerase [Acidimicrobiia bacterium]|nr:5-deoxy-glucuronate isomerase [Acidimicrobiia bacterium]
MTAAGYRGAHVELALPVLEPNEPATFTPQSGEEGALVLLSGALQWLGVDAGRGDVFEGRASAVFLPAGSCVEIRATTACELAFATTVGAALEPAAEHPVAIQPGDVVVHERGRPPWQRAVHDVIGPDVPACRLLVGETFNEPGQWSSFPPHKHDGADGEPALEEVYYYRFDRRDGFGFQGLYDADGDERAVLLRHGAVVGIPHGYHPVCAAPGYRLYYLWALAGSPRQLTMYEDPAHRWLNES